MSLPGPNRARIGRALAAWSGVAVAALTSVTAVARLGAQPLRAPVGAQIVRATPDSSGAPRLVADPFQDWRLAAASAPAAPKRATPWAPLASAVVPGLGQALLRQAHGVVYGAIEVYMWLSAREAHRFSNAQRNEYRDIARTIARRDAPGTKPDGTWDYYEQLEKLCLHRFQFQTRCLSSGLFDRVAGGALDPETDINTYNGQVWGEAVKTYGTRLPDGSVVPPAVGSTQYVRALDYYRGLAHTPEFYWSWVGQQQQQDVYRQAIGKSNDKFDEYQHDMHVIIANHVLSMVDAAMTVRLRRYGTPGTSRSRRTGFEASVPWAPFGRPRRMR